MDAPFLVVGLGNPGPQYAGNRHSVGFLAADLLAERVGGRVKRHSRAHAEVCEAHLRPGGPRRVIAKPLAYMNTSGGPAATLASFYKIPVDRVIAIHDDLDLSYGTLKLKIGGGEGGHNGLRSLTKALGTRDYLRVRFGIGRPPGRQDPADFVLSDFSAAERKDLDYLLDRTVDALEAVVDRGLEWAQNAYHAG